MVPQRDNRMKVTALLRAGPKVSDVANLIDLAQPSKRSRSAWTMAKVSRVVGDRKTVVDRYRLSTTACTSVDTFAIVHRLLDRVGGCARHPDKVRDFSHVMSRTKEVQTLSLNCLSAEPF